jgi:hypothetical protein
MDAGYSFRGSINQLSPESEHSPLSSAEFENQWGCISAPLVRLYECKGTTLSALLYSLFW